MTHQDLLGYQKGFLVAMKVFNLSKSFPKEETYLLTDQIRRSSRSVCANTADAYRKRDYPKHFYSKLTDCDAKNYETHTWFEFCYACGSISEGTFILFCKENEEVGETYKLHDSKSK